MITIILPTYNESGHIARLISDILEHASRAGDHEIVVVDDNSPDGTAAIVGELAVADGRVRVERRMAERGLATAVWRGIQLARGEIVVVMDADFDHDPAEIPKMCALLEHFDLVTGSRFTMRGGMASRRRYIASYLFNVMLRLLLRTQVQDNLSGYFAARTALVRRIEQRTVFYGYGDYFMRLLILAWRAGWSILEVPVFYRGRPTGSSKTTLTRTLPLYLAAVVRIRLGIDRPVTK